MTLAPTHSRDHGWIQDNVSMSARGVLRGMHFQHPHGQAKLVTVLEGEIFDVTVDVRRDSPSFGRIATFHLGADADNQLHIPEGFAHGFYVRSESALIHYRCSQTWDPSAEKIIIWSDPALDIPWPMDTPPKLSGKDAAGRLLASFSPDELPPFCAASTTSANFNGRP
jgi:dTDP-4-dehydrorhamnose 3,5-epimerase